MGLLKLHFILSQAWLRFFCCSSKYHVRNNKQAVQTTTSIQSLAVSEVYDILLGARKIHTQMTGPTLYLCGKHNNIKYIWKWGSSCENETEETDPQVYSQPKKNNLAHRTSAHLLFSEYLINGALEEAQEAYVVFSFFKKGKRKYF